MYRRYLRCASSSVFLSLTPLHTMSLWNVIGWSFRKTESGQKRVILFTPRYAVCRYLSASQFCEYTESTWMPVYECLITWKYCMYCMYVLINLYGLKLLWCPLCLMQDNDMECGGTAGLSAPLTTALLPLLATLISRWPLAGPNTGPNTGEIDRLAHHQMLTTHREPRQQEELAQLTELLIINREMDQL